MNLYISDLIKKAIKENTTFLDLGNIGLTSIPEEILTIPDSVTQINLNSNNFSNNTLSLALLSQLTNINALDIVNCEICDLCTPSLARLNNLISLNLYKNNIGNEGAKQLSKLSDLTFLNLGFNNIGTKGAQSLEKLSNLTSLNLCHNNIGKGGAKILAKLSKLTSLNVSDNQIKYAFHFNKLKKLKKLNIKNNPIRDVPESLYQEDYNCINNMRIWWQEVDGEDKVKSNEIVKLQILGNSNTGKSSIIEALKKGQCQQQFDSTHGIVIKALKFQYKSKKVKFQVWDFGGQEIYHGTHRLFIASQSIHLLVTDLQSELQANERARVPDRANPDEKVLHQPLQHYIDTSKRKSPNSLRIIIENKIDEHNNQPSQLIQEIAERNNILYFSVSATKGTEIKALRKVLAKTRKDILHYGMPMPISWLKVRQYFIDNIAVPIIDRHRRISLDKYQQICDRFKVWDKARPALLEFLHSTGIIYKNDAFFKDTIIADQRWALEAIYKPLDRSGDIYHKLRNKFKGRVRIKSLFKAFGNGYNQEYKWSFLDLMFSCGLCFPVNELDWRENKKQTEDSYCIFPEFLPAQAPHSIADIWDGHDKVKQFEYRPEYLDYFSIQRFIIELGHKTKIQYIWKNGILVVTDNGLFHVEADAAYSKITVSIEEKLIGEYLPLIIGLFDRDDKHWFTADGKVLSREALKQRKLGHKTKVSTVLDSKSLTTALPDVPQKIKKLVVSFAYQNIDTVKALEKQLSTYNSKLELLYDKKIIKGKKDWNKDIRHMFENADGYIIILSTDYQFQKEHPYIWDCEVPIMLQRRADEDIFIYCLPVDFFDVCEEFKGLDVFTNNSKVLPKDETEVTKYLRGFARHVIADKFLAEDEDV
jgi:internalin A